LRPLDARPWKERAMRSIKAIVGERQTIIVDALTTVGDAARLMASHQIGAVPVLEGERLAGIFTERDVLTRVVAAARDAERTPVREVMSTELVIADVGEGYEVCLTRMQQAHVRHLILLDCGRLAGILSLRDLLRVDLDEKEEAITMLNAYVHYIPT
jgi:CBS domain-containing protein